MPKTSSWISSRSWQEQHIADGGQLFPRYNSLVWFLRNNRADLITAGVYFPASGQRAAMVRGDKFDSAVQEILGRQARESLSSAA